MADLDTVSLATTLPSLFVSWTVTSWRPGSGPVHATRGLPFWSVTLMTVACRGGLPGGSLTFVGSAQVRAVAIGCRPAVVERCVRAGDVARVLERLGRAPYDAPDVGLGAVDARSRRQGPKRADDSHRSEGQDHDGDQHLHERQAVVASRNAIGSIMAQSRLLHDAGRAHIGVRDVEVVRCRVTGVGRGTREQSRRPVPSC